jgi:hypothetical protein
MDWGWSIGGLQPGPTHSNQRKMLRKSIGPQRISSYFDTIESEMAKFTTVLHKFKGNPANTVQRSAPDRLEGIVSVNNLSTQ